MAIYIAKTNLAVDSRPVGVVISKTDLAVESRPNALLISKTNLAVDSEPPPVVRKKRRPLIMVFGALRDPNAVVTDPFWANVLLLSGMNGVADSTAFMDESNYARTIATAGNARVDAANKKFGTGSLLLDGSGDYLTIPDSNDWMMNGQFTVEGWFRFSTKQDSQALMGQWDDAGASASNAWFLYIANGQLLFRYMNGTTLRDTAAAFVPTLGEWYHIAVSRNAANLLRVFVNGVLIASATQSSTMNNVSRPLTIGRIGSSTTNYAAFDFNGNVDEVRITGGVCRYDSDSFPVPTAAFPRQ